MPLPGLPKLTTPKQETLPEPGQANPTAMSIGLALAGMAQGITNQNTLGLAVAELERQRHRLAQTQAANLGIENNMAQMEADMANTREKLKYEQGMSEHKRVTGEAHDIKRGEMAAARASQPKPPPTSASSKADVARIIGTADNLEKSLDAIIRGDVAPKKFPDGEVREAPVNFPFSVPLPGAKKTRSMYDEDGNEVGKTYESEDLLTVNNFADVSKWLNENMGLLEGVNEQEYKTLTPRAQRIRRKLKQLSSMDFEFSPPLEF